MFFHYYPFLVLFLLTLNYFKVSEQMQLFWVITLYQIIPTQHNTEHSVSIAWNRWHLKVYLSCWTLVCLTDCEQVEHCPYRPDDILPWGSRQHAGIAGPAGEVREQNPDTYQDRSELEDAESLSPGCLLHSKGAGRSWHVVHGTRADTTVRSAVVQADGCWYHSFPVWNEPWRRSAYSKFIQVFKLFFSLLSLQCNDFVFHSI